MRKHKILHKYVSYADNEKIELWFLITSRRRWRIIKYFHGVRSEETKHKKGM